ncbi:MAG: glycosyltransferase [Candidatus Pacebacteria bacterium]|nr:glycosyltransferase [Candidatus Paceibacterota bacterium]
MVNFNQKKLGLFFSHGISLKNWEDIGHLNREIAFYKRIADNFEEIIFFTYGGKNDLRYQENLGPKSNIKIIPKPWGLPKILYGFLLPLIHWVKLKDISVLKTNQMSSAIPAVIAKLCWRKKKLIIRNGYEWLKILENEKKPFWKKIVVYLWEKIAYKVGDIVVFTSQKDKDFAQKKFKIPERKIRFVPNYIDTELFGPLNIPKEKNSVIYVGRLSKEKNLFNLISAMTGLNAKLAVVGQGDLQGELEKLAKEKEVLVEFKGKIDNKDLPKELSKAEVFVLPSLYEGCPKALLEAMSCGLACIGTDVEGIKEVIIHKENGYLCQTDSQSIHQALKDVLNDKELREKIGEKARKSILENFSFEKIIQKESSFFSNLKVLILAGGRGARLWPLSRTGRPKQFQRLTSAKTMLQETVWRLSPDIAWGDIFISTNNLYEKEIAKELPKLPKENIIVELFNKERLAALLLFLVHLPERFYNEPLLILPSDYNIPNADLFKKVVLTGENFIKRNPDYIFMIGSKPDFPNTGLGYIKKGQVKEQEGFNIFEVDNFIEKPSIERAVSFVEQGNYFFNIPVYVFLPQLILTLIKQYLPNSFAKFQEIKKAIGRSDFKNILAKEYPEIEETSLENSIFAKYKKIVVLEIKDNWSDLGSWDSLRDFLSNKDENFTIGNHIDLDSKNILVFSQNNEQLVATIGVSNLVIAVSKDVILVCNKNDSQKVKQIVEILKKENKSKYL